MTGIEEERLLKLQGTSSCAENFSYIFHYDEIRFPSSLLWHAIIGHLNYENLRMLKKSGVVVCLEFLGNLSKVMLLV